MLTAPADLADVRGQLLARRALEVACAGGHNLLLVGPPGSGKTLMARRVPGILPPMTFDEALEVTADSLGCRASSARHRSGRRASVPRAAPHHLERRVDWRRLAAAARRSEPRPSRRAVPRRDARVQPPRARGVATAARGRRGDDCEGVTNRTLPRPLRARGRDESMSVWLRRRDESRVPLHAAANRPLPLEAVRAAARSSRPHGGGARRSRPTTLERRVRRALGRVFALGSCRRASGSAIATPTMESGRTRS